MKFFYSKNMSEKEMENFHSVLKTLFNDMKKVSKKK